MSRKIYNRLSLMAVSWLDESTLASCHPGIVYGMTPVYVNGYAV